MVSSSSPRGKLLRYSWLLFAMLLVWIKADFSTKTLSAVDLVCRATCVLTVMDAWVEDSEMNYNGGSLTHLLPGQFFCHCHPRVGLGFAEVSAGYLVWCRCTAELHVLNDEYTGHWHLKMHINWRDNSSVAANVLRNCKLDVMLVLSVGRWLWRHSSSSSR